MGDTFDLKTKVDRAVYALIVGMGVGNKNNTYPGEATIGSRTLPNTTIDSGECFEEDLQPGNFRFPGGKISFRDDATLQPNESNPQAPFLLAQQRVTAIIGQLVLSDDQTTLDYTRRQLNYWGRLLATDASNETDATAAQTAANNQDMLDFTLLYWRITDYGVPKKIEGVTFYEREVMFECVACNSNID